MPEGLPCPQCGTSLPAGAPAGLCPACLLKMGAAEDTAAEGRQPPFHPPSAAELAPLFPQLEILELIGKGGMGAVYKVRQKELDRIVALKILPPGIGEEPAFAGRFAREAKALAKLNHPGIVTIYDFGRADRLFYFLMEFVDGVNLAQLLHAGRISPREALAIVPQICDALQFAHDQGIVHRDIKPENILMDRRGRLKVADFGLAKLVGVGNEPAAAQGPVAGSPALTESGKVMGTPNYMAPEQVENPDTVDHRADIYALGVVFYQMLTGELPGKQLEPPSRKVQIDLRLDEVVLRALETKPERRYQQVSEVKTCVETITANPPLEQTKHRTPNTERPESRLAFIRIPFVMMRDGNPTTNWPVVILAGGCMASLMGGSLGLAAAIGIPDALVRWVLFAMVLPVFVLIPLWLSLEIQAGHRALETGVQPWPLFSKRKNRAHRLVGLALACLFIAFILRTFVAAPYRVEIDAAAPEFPYGSQFLVWRLTRHFAPGDLIAYWHDGLANMGRVVRNKNGVLSVNQNGNPDVAVPREAVIGKVISVYWRASNILESAPGNAASIPNTHSASGGAPQLMQEGQQLWQAGKLAEAAVKFNQAVALAPEDANAWNELGWATFNSGKPEEARKAFQQAVSLDPSQPGALNGLGQLYLAQRNYDQAEAYLLKAAPQAPAAWYGLTRLYLLEGKFEQAARWAQDLIDAGQADDLVRQMLRAAQARQLSEGLRFRIEPPLPNPGEKVAPNAASSESGSPALSELPPVPVETQPVSGSRDVASGETEIRVRFSKEMTDDSWSWSTAWENSTPEFIGPPHFESDGRTCVAKAKLEPGRMYAFWLNSDRFHGFKDRDGHPAVPYLLIFQTQQK